MRMENVFGEEVFKRTHLSRTLWVNACSWMCSSFTLPHLQLLKMLWKYCGVELIWWTSLHDVSQLLHKYSIIIRSKICHICRRYNILAHCLLHWVHILHIKHVICLSALVCWYVEDKNKQSNSLSLHFTNCPYICETLIFHFYCPGVFSHLSIYNTSVL